MGSLCIDGRDEVTNARIRDEIGRATRVTLIGALDPRWAEVVAAAAHAEYLDLWGPGQQLLDAIGGVLPRLSKLEAMSCSAEREASGVDLSALFAGVNACPNLRTVGLVSVRGVTTTTVLAPARRVLVALADDCPRLLEALAGNHVKLFVPARVPIPRTVRAIHERPPASLALSYADAATARRCAARDFLDLRDASVVGIHGTDEDPAEADREFQERRARSAKGCAENDGEIGEIGKIGEIEIL